MVAFLPLAMMAIQGRDIVLADFEGKTYGRWEATGTAFGPGPAQGTLPNQMAVDGFAGKGLANSFYGGDDATGTLTSPAFKVDRKNIRFLIGGGKNPEKLRLDLLVDGKVVRTATGLNDRPGGSEALVLSGWDVSEFVGKTASIQIVDQATGGWGHLNVDQIVLTDRRLPALLHNAERTFTIKGRYLNLPVKNGARKRWVTITVPGEAPRRFDIELADGKPDWWAFIDVSAWEGKSAKVQVDEISEESQGLSSMELSNEIKGAKDLYREALRPQLHFTSRRGWLNDPNGLVYYQGEYHLFYQHNPFGWGWGNMSWGHAVSGDLVHWKELPVALHPDPSGTMYSGSAVVDWQNTAGFGKEALVAMYTAAGRPFTQGIAYSNDKGRTWTKYAGNPVIKHIEAENRDPKVIWYAPTKRWVMALYLDREDYAIFNSKDLKTWERTDTVAIPGTSECPNFFPMRLDGDDTKQKWILFGANGGYLVGDFDGSDFKPDGPPKRMQNGNCWYAAQVFSDIPNSDGRTILIPWGQMNIPGMPFNQLMGLPVELRLESTPEGPTIFSTPTRELESLRAGGKKADPAVGTFDVGETAELSVAIEAGSSSPVEFDLRGVKVTYDPVKGEVRCLDRTASIKPLGGMIRFRIFLDRTNIDIFGNDGRLYMPMGTLLDPKNRSVRISGPSAVRAVTVYLLKSMWK